MSKYFEHLSSIETDKINIWCKFKVPTVIHFWTTIKQIVP